MSVDDLVEADGEYGTIVEIKGSYAKVEFLNGRKDIFKLSDIKKVGG